MIKIALVTNTPPPYRIPIFNYLATWPGVDFYAIFATRREPNRHWNLPDFKFQHTFLRECYFTFRGRYIHHNPDVITMLWKLAPDVIITDGFNPTHLYAYLIARLRKIPHIAMTDGTDQSEKFLSFVHKLIRRHVYAHTQSYISASEGGDRLYQDYGIAAERCFHSWLCVDNKIFKPSSENKMKEFDFIYCSRFELIKDPHFALRVAYVTAQKMQRRLSILMVGSGHEETALRNAADKYTQWLDIKFYGFATQQELPDLYRSAKIFLFPTHADAWGIVANEACAAGLPTLISPYAGAAGELVLDGENGFVRKLELTEWTDCAQRLLTDTQLYKKFSTRSLQLVEKYNFQSAAEGLIEASRFAMGKKILRANCSVLSHRRQ